MDDELGPEWITLEEVEAQLSGEPPVTPEDGGDSPWYRLLDRTANYYAPEAAHGGGEKRLRARTLILWAIRHRELEPLTFVDAETGVKRVYVWISNFHDWAMVKGYPLEGSKPTDAPREDRPDKQTKKTASKAGKSTSEVDFAELGRKGAEVRHEPMRKLEAWAIERYLDGKWKSANQAAAALKEDVIAHGKTINAILAPQNAQTTIRKWILKHKKLASSGQSNHSSGLNNHSSG